MRFGICTGPENIELLEKLGYDYIELNASKMLTLSEEELESIREKLNTQKTYDIYTSLLGLNPGITLDLLSTRKFIPRLNIMKRKLTSKEFDTYTFYIEQPFLKQFMNEININFVPDTVSNDKRCNLE